MYQVTPSFAYPHQIRQHSPAASWEHLPSLRWQVVRRLSRRACYSSPIPIASVPVTSFPIHCFDSSHYHGIGISHHRILLSPSNHVPVYSLSRPCLSPRPKAVVWVIPICYPCFPRRALPVRPSTVEKLSLLTYESISTSAYFSLHGQLPWIGHSVYLFRLSPSGPFPFCSSPPSTPLTADQNHGHPAPRLWTVEVSINFPTLPSNLSEPARIRARTQNHWHGTHCHSSKEVLGTCVICISGEPEPRRTTAVRPGEWEPRDLIYGHHGGFLINTTCVIITISLGLCGPTPALVIPKGLAWTAGIPRQILASLELEICYPLHREQNYLDSPCKSSRNLCTLRRIG